ncbi:GT4 family glycosyltransferase PelF [Paenibacillus sp. YYML68]|uniref:GT4 family glycosyltransferase PelF n=1 Tax=Paenibacillus sp. YYML68 TaxID=2909250 RepID=UPI002493B3B6|nr:GT4 family glycosyltransferase PelF [Paenibacillus sp. YYML68]
MKICIVAEGSYPYITGGVSSWIHALITSMPQHEFILLTVGAEEKMKGKYKYTLPPNVSAVHESFLDVFLREEDKWGKTFSLSADEYSAFKSLISGGADTNWDALFKLLLDKRWETSTEFLMSKDYFDLLSELGREKYSQLPFREMFWTVRSMLLPLMQLLRQTIPEADLYHAVSTGYAGVLASFGKQLYGRPMLLTEHGIYSREREEEIIKADWVKGYFKDIWIQFFYGLASCAYLYSDKVITLFGRNLEMLIELGCPSEKASIIPNGVRTNDYMQLPQPEEGHFREKVIIGAIVRVVPIKDIKTMLLGFVHVKREVPNAELIVMGPTEEDKQYYRECLELVDLLGIEDVTFTGSVNIKEYLGRMDLMLLTSISEGQPLAILEGLAAGKPFVSTDVGGCRELLYGRNDSYGQAGYVVPVMNDEELAKAIIRLCRNEQERIRMGLNGRNRVLNDYTHEQFISKYEELYDELGMSIGTKGEREWRA